MDNEEEENKNREMNPDHDDDESIINPQDLEVLVDEVLLNAAGKLSVIPDEAG